VVEFSFKPATASWPGTNRYAFFAESLPQPVAESGK